jgi:hypothetical protein
MALDSGISSYFFIPQVRRDFDTHIALGLYAFSENLCNSVP